MSSRTRSGLLFSPPKFGPYDCASLRLPQFALSSPCTTSQDLDTLLQDAARRRELENAADGDDAEGAELTSGPSVAGDPYTPIHPRAPLPRPDVPSGLTPEQQRKIAAKERRRTKRVAAALAHTPYSRPTAASRASASTSAPPLPDDKPVLLFDINAQLFPRSKGGSWIGKRSKPDTSLLSLQPDVNTLLAKGFGYVGWDGAAPKQVYDSKARGFVTLAGRPDDPEWDRVIRDAAAAMEAVRDEGLQEQHIHTDDLHHRRGDFVALATGVSHGGGQLKPGNLQHTASRGRLVRSLLQDKNIRRIAGFQSSAFAAFSPKVYKHYSTQLGQLFDHDPALEHNFSNSIMPACTFNCGPSTCTVRHTDFGNWPPGQCLITAMGDYDPKKGGHLVLYSLKLIIEFPPGSTVLIPSGAVEHGNIPLQPGERRLSFTQYAAGGLFRWVAYNFKTVKSLLDEENGKARRAEIDGREDERWTAGINLYSKMGELERDREMIFGKK